MTEIKAITLAQFDRRQAVADTDIYGRLFRAAVDAEKRYTLDPDGKICGCSPSDGSAEMDAYYRGKGFRSVAMHDTPFEDRIVYHATRTSLCKGCDTFQEVIDCLYNHYATKEVEG